MDIEDIRMYLRKSPDLLSNIKKIQDYRDLRTKQVYYAKLLSEYRNYDCFNKSGVSKIVRNANELDKSYWEMEVRDLDRVRRQYHNCALSAFRTMVLSGERNGLPKIYDGILLDGTQIERHERTDLREQMTDAMFDVLYTIEKGAIQQEQESEEIKEIQGRIEKFNRQYNVKEPMRKDESNEKDGGIVFELAAIFDNFFEG